jgi:hypothetical protein
MQTHKTDTMAVYCCLLKVLGMSLQTHMLVLPPATPPRTGQHSSSTVRSVTVRLRLPRNGYVFSVKTPPELIATRVILNQQWQEGVKLHIQDTGQMRAVTV